MNADPTPPSPRDRSPRPPEELLEAARAGDRSATGRLLSLVERGGPTARAVGKLVFGLSGDPTQVIGITGAPGAGKSTLVDRLISVARGEGTELGILAVDPTSPFTGGAILGDRIRMQDHALDDGVFIRSMASRGHLGGLALAAPEAIRVLIASGMSVVLVETVGVGQVEVEIAGAADTTVVVVNPGWGDSVQASKAGLLEVADVFVVNKSDRPGAAETARDLESMLDLGSGHNGWRPPVLLTSAATGEGADGLWAGIKQHREHLMSGGDMVRRREQRLIDELGRVLVSRIERNVKQMEGGVAFEAVKSDLIARKVDPYEAADCLLGTWE